MCNPNSEHPASEYRRIIRAAATVLFSLLIARAAGAIKEIVIAYRYGTSPVVDGYLFVFNLSYWIASAVDSIMMFSLVPFLSRMRAERKEAMLSEFRHELLGAALVASSVISLLSIGMLSLLIASGYSGLTPEASEAARLAASLLPMGLVLCFLSTVLFVWTVAREQHLSSIADAMPAVGISLAVLTSPHAIVQPLVVGTLAGFLLRWAFLATFSRQPLRTLIPRFRFRSALWRDFAQGISVVAIAQGILVSTNFVDTFFAVRQGEGALSTYNYAYRATTLLLSLLAIPISRSVLPIFSQAPREAGSASRFELANRLVWSAAGVGIVVASIGWIVSEPLVHLIYERGAFSAQDTVAVSTVLRCLLLQVPFYVSWIVLFNWHVSQRAYQVNLKASIWVLSTKILSAWLLSSLYGIEGLALSSAVMYLVGSGYTYLAARLSNRRREV